MKSFFFFATALVMLYAGAEGQSVSDLVAKNISGHRELYRYLHGHPELSFMEQSTASMLSEKLENRGFEVTRKIGGNGFVGVLRNGEGPVVMIRTDMDALPLREKTGLSYASTINMTDADSVMMPVMHACGHDMHMSVWLGTASVLASLKDQWQGTLIFLAQPAEEKGAGAAAMLADGLYERFPVPDAAVAFHVNAEMPAGTIGYRQGPLMAGVNSVDITVFGVGGHGAMPHRAIDPVVLSSRIVLALQTIVSREIDPLEPAVVTVGSIHGGTVHNIIPDQVKMQLTVRFYDDPVYDHIIASLNRISAGIAVSAGLPEDKYPLVEPVGRLTPPLVNDAGLTSRVAASFGREIGEENVIEVKPITAAEDFSLYGRTKEEVPIAMFWLGSVNKSAFDEHEAGGRELPGLHSPLYHPDFGPTYTTGVRAMSAAVLDLLNE